MMSLLGSFSVHIARIMRPEWQMIPDPNSDEWNKAFDESVDQYITRKEDGCNYLRRNETIPNTVDTDVDLSNISQEEDFELSCKAVAMLEGIWLAGKKKVEAIEQCSKSHELQLDDVVVYAKRLRGTTYSPPENMNVHDPTRHYEMFPQYHFLGAPAINEMHNSRLFALSKLAQHSSAPKIFFEPVSEDMRRMRLECTTKGAVIHYQTSRANMEQINPHTGQPTVYTTAPAVYDGTKKLNFKVTSNRFIVYAWSTCEGLRQSEVVTAEYNPPSGEQTSTLSTKKSFSFFLGKKREQEP